MSTATTTTTEDHLRLAALLEENQKLRHELEVKTRTTARALASYQQRALQMEIIRQQNEDLDRLAADLAKARAEEGARARELEAQARAKSEMIASFSHEIRTPLNAIIGYCELVVQEEGERLSSHGLRDMGVIRANARTLLTLINDILDLSTFESGRVDVVREPVDMREVLDECLTAVRDVTTRQGVTLTGTLEDDARHAYSDAMKLRQILLNLLSNAAKFTEAGAIDVRVAADGAKLVLEVSDTGVGISPDAVPHVFETFRKADGASGLGLAIVRELSRLLGGTTQVVSVLGHGATFTVTLPGAIDARARPTSTRPAGARAPSRPPRPQPLRVLVADGDGVSQRELGDAVDSGGYRALLVSDGVSALRAARDQPFDAIVLDASLPRLDGFHVLSELKCDPKLAGTPVVIVATAEHRARAFSAGACECLVRPFDAKALVDVLRRALTPDVGDVLVVDDDASSRELLCRSLQTAGIRTSQARDGEDALSRIRIARPGLVITDLDMPTMDGFELLRRLRDEGNHVAVVVVTGRELTGAEAARLRDARVRVIAKGGLAADEVVREALRLLADAQASRAS